MILFGMSMEYENDKAVTDRDEGFGLTGLSETASRLRCACLLGLSIALLSERAATFPGPIPAARHGNGKRQAAREIPGESVPPMIPGAFLLITTTCTHHFMKRHRLSLDRKKAETWIIPVVLQKHQPLPPRLYCLTTPFRFNVKFTIFMGRKKKNINQNMGALCHY